MAIQPWGKSSGSIRRGLTLVELLVVTAVLASLAALLFPVFSRVRDRGYQRVCVSNLRQITQAGLMYVSDYDDRFPACYRTPYPPYVVDSCTALQPYIRDWTIFYCPNRRTVLPQCLDPLQGYQPGSRCMGYGYNWGSGLTWETTTSKADGLVRPLATANGVGGVLLGEVAAPSHCFFYADTNDFTFLTLLRGAMPGVRKDGAVVVAANDVGQPYEGPRHSSGNNFAFVDGHVQWLPIPGGRWIDGGPWVVPDMSMYSRTGRWEARPVP